MMYDICLRIDEKAYHFVEDAPDALTAILQLGDVWRKHFNLIDSVKVDYVRPAKGEGF